MQAPQDGTPSDAAQANADCNNGLGAVVATEEQLPPRAAEAAQPDAGAAADAELAAAADAGPDVPMPDADDGEDQAAAEAAEHDGDKPAAAPAAARRPAKASLFGIVCWIGHAGDGTVEPAAKF